MKYTTKQILAFSAMAYEKELEKVGGRSGYMTKDGVKVNAIKRSWMHTAVPLAISAQTLYISIYNSVNIGYEGFSLNAGITVLASLIISALSARLFIQGGKVHQAYVRDLMEHARGYEPEALWNMSYPEGKNQVASLIASLLGARLIIRKMIANTSIPMDTDVVDARVTHLVKELATSRPDDIHPYVLDEVKSICRQAVQDFNFYEPIISFQDEVQKEFAERLNASR